MEYVKKMDAYLDTGTKALERYLWNDSYYIDYNEPEIGRHLPEQAQPPLWLESLTTSYQLDAERLRKRLLEDYQASLKNPGRG